MNLFQRVEDYLFDDRSRLSTPSQEYPTNHRWPARVAHSLARSIWLLGTCSWTNTFIPLIPFAIWYGRAGRDPTVVFALNYLALLPTIGLYRYGNEIMSASVGDNLKTTWNLTVGAFSVDIEVALIALLHGELGLVKAYIAGKIASTLLLTLGICFIVAAVRRKESTFSITASYTMIGLLATSMVSFSLITLYPHSKADHTKEDDELISRAFSIVLLALYIFYRVFRLSHGHLFARDEYAPHDGDTTCLAPRNPGSAVAVVTLVACIWIAYECAENLLVSVGHGLAPPIVPFGFCLLPLLSEVAKISEVARLAWQDRIDVCLGVAAGAAIQVAMLITPVFCLLGWALGIPMNLRLNIPEGISFFCTIWVFSSLVRDGKSNYLEGAMSLGVYMVLMLAYCTFPLD